MIPIDFPQAFRTLGAPEGSPDVTPLRVWTDGRECISAWMPTEGERAQLIAGEPLFLRVTSGATMHPVALEVGSPFVDEAFADHDAATLRRMGIAP